MLPPDHPQRLALNDEVHARPVEPLTAPCTLVYIAIASAGERRSTDWREARALFARLGHDLPDTPVSHAVAERGGVRLVLERHSEFIRYTAIAPDRHTADLAVIMDSVAALTGALLVATRVDICQRSADLDKTLAERFDGEVVIGAALSDGAASAFTDFRVREDRFSRLLLEVDHARPRQLGRMVQRLLEIDTYRMMALLALPLARELRPQIEAMDQDLVAIARGIAQTGAQNEARLLEDLTALEARAQQAMGETHYRLSASGAYRNIVDNRIHDLREQRIEGLQTFAEFTARRLAPAMDTCRTVAENLRDLSLRIAQTTALLTTRVEIVREQQNRDLLASMARRTKLQVQLQRTVEGLSVIAVSYYLLGLVGYGLKGIKGLGLNINVDLLTGLAVPLVLWAVATGLGRLIPKRKTDS